MIKGVYEIENVFGSGWDRSKESLESTGLALKSLNWVGGIDQDCLQEWGWGDWSRVSAEVF